MKILELFSGTGSVGKVAKSKGHSVISLDLKNSDINTDTLNWDYKMYEPEYFDFIWASPPCTEYSIAKRVGVRNIDYANSIVLKTLEIIDYLKPKYYVIENPQTGLLKNQPFMNGIDFTDVDYCKYGFNYRKRTRLWNNLNHTLKLEPLCCKDCGKVMNNRHLEIAQRGGRNKSHSQKELYTIPPKLIEDVFNSIN